MLHNLHRATSQLYLNKTGKKIIMRKSLSKGSLWAVLELMRLSTMGQYHQQAFC